MKRQAELQHSSNKFGWLLTALILGILGAVVGYLEAPNAPLLIHSPRLCAMLGALICVAFIAGLFLADRYRL